MNGTRALTDQEVAQITSNLTKMRDKVLFVLGVKTGFRISELLSLKVSDVFINGKVRDKVTVHKANMKKQTRARTIPLHTEAKTLLEQYINTEYLPGDSPLFYSRKGNDSITRMQAHRILKEAFEGLTGKVACHSMRKTFGTKVYEKTGKDLRATQVALGHESINSTVKYLAVDENYVQDIILSL